MNQAKQGKSVPRPNRLSWNKHVEHIVSVASFSRNGLWTSQLHDPPSTPAEWLPSKDALIYAHYLPFIRAITALGFEVSEGPSHVPAEKNSDTSIRWAKATLHGVSIGDDLLDLSVLMPLGLFEPVAAIDNEELVPVSQHQLERLSRILTELKIDLGLPTDDLNDLVYVES